MSARLDIKLRAIMTSCSLAVLAVRACAQGGLAPPGVWSGRAFALPQASRGGWGGAVLPNDRSDNANFMPCAPWILFLEATTTYLEPSKMGLVSSVN